MKRIPTSSSQSPPARTLSSHQSPFSSIELRSRTSVELDEFSPGSRNSALAGNKSRRQAVIDHTDRRGSAELLSDSFEAGIDNPRGSYIESDMGRVRSAVSTPDQPLLEAHTEYDSAGEGASGRRGSSISTGTGEMTDFERAWARNRSSYQLLALVCALLISVGSHYSAHTLGALKSTIKKELGITNAQYGALQSTVSAVNTVLPVLGGVFVDTFGTTSGSLLATLLIMIGNLIISISTHTRSFSTMVIGRMLYGFGSGTVIVVQETILGSWFKGKGLAITIAIQITTSRVASFLSMGTAIPVANKFGFYGAAFWANFLVCAISFGINLLYMVTMRRFDRSNKRMDVIDNESGSSEDREASGIGEDSWNDRLKTKHRFNPRLVFFFAGIYWLLIIESFTLGGGWNSFLHINSELVKLRFGANDQVAAWSASVSQVMPIFLVPCLGWFLDKYGMRTDLLILSTSMFSLSMLLLGFTWANPLIGLIIFSISLALGPLSEITAISLLLPAGALGTGLGIYKSATNVGSTVVDIVVGVLQDNGPKIIEDRRSYNYAMAFFVFWGVSSTCVAICIYFVDKYKWSSLLRGNSIERREALFFVKWKIKRQLDYVDLPNWRDFVPIWKYIPLVAFNILLAVSLVLFVVKLA